MPRYSLILPTRNRADVVGFAIRSVLAQSIRDWELFVVGDGCTDHTASVVSSFDDPRITWLDLPKAPHYGYANRNVALRRTTGEFIACIAHDDLLFPDHLELLGGQLERERADWIFSRPLWVSMDGVIVPYAVRLLSRDERDSFMINGNPIPMSCVMHRRTIGDSVGGWPEDVPRSADWELWKRMLAAGATIASCRTPTTLHFVADWRRQSQLGQPEAMVLLGLSRTEAWWPDALRFTIPSGVTEQAVFSTWLAETDASRIAQFRAAVDVVIDRLAWDRTCDLRRIASARSLPARIAGRLLGSRG